MRAVASSTVPNRPAPERICCTVQQIPCRSSSSRLRPISLRMSRGRLGTRKDAGNTIGTYRARCKARKIRRAISPLFAELLSDPDFRYTRIRRRNRVLSTFVNLFHHHHHSHEHKQNYNDRHNLLLIRNHIKNAASAVTAQWPVCAKSLNSDN
jgi:hypothetical protein